MRNFVLTSEAVTSGHPDKLCDRISDAMVDACLAADAPVGCVAECALASGIVFLSLRHGGPLDFDPAALARRVLDGDGGRTTVMLDLVETPDLPGPGEDRPVARQMTTAFGYATDATAARMPLPILLAHRIGAGLEAARAGPMPWLSADAQVQVAVRFRNRRAEALDVVAVGFYADGPPPGASALDDAMRGVIDPAAAELGLAPGGHTRLVLRQMPGPGGPHAHAGLTGRKTAADGYGGFARQGSSALSGKDPSRIERVAACAARQAAVSVVAAGLARECEVQLSYVPGDEGPASLEIDSFETGAMPDEAISARLAAGIDLRIGAIVARLGLWDLPRARGGRFYRDLASGGQMGRPELDLPWDRPLPLEG
jgi:S-adenosylmethionine synthetase